MDMKNPWKRYSKINPQREQGRREIANDVFLALIGADLTGAEYKVTLAIIHKTWGYNKSSDAISIKQLSEMTQLSERTIKRTLKRLTELRVTVRSPSKIRVSTGSPLTQFLFNKHYDTWTVTGLKNIEKAVEDDIVRVTAGSPTKERTKENKDYCRNLEISNLLLTEILTRRNSFKKPNLKTWAKQIDLMIRLDERDPEEIKKIISWCQKDDFWQDNILSTSKLRTQFDQLALKMSKDGAKKKKQIEDEPPYWS